MTDKFKNFYTDIDSPVVNIFEITPSGNTDLPYVTRAIYVGGDGDITLETLGGEIVTMVGVKGGMIYPLRVKRVDANTSATDLLGLY